MLQCFNEEKKVFSRSHSLQNVILSEVEDLNEICVNAKML